MASFIVNKMKQTVMYNRSLRVSSRKLMRQLRSQKHKAMKGMNDICCQVPTKYIPNLHENHNFMNVYRILKHKNPLEAM